MSNQFSWTLFNQMPLIGIMRNVPPEYTAPIAKTFSECGLTCLEITMKSFERRGRFYCNADNKRGSDSNLRCGKCAHISGRLYAIRDI